MNEEPRTQEKPLDQIEHGVGSTGEDEALPPADNYESDPSPLPAATSKEWDKAKFLDSLEVVSDGTRQLYEMQVEAKRLKKDLCKMVAEIINFTEVSIPLAPDILEGPGFQVKEAIIGCEGVIEITLTNGCKKFKRLADFDNRSVLKLIYDMVPKFRSAIESELKVLSDDINLMDKAVADFKKAQPALRNDQSDMSSVDIVRET